MSFSCDSFSYSLHFSFREATSFSLSFRSMMLFLSCRARRQHEVISMMINSNAIVLLIFYAIRLVKLRLYAVVQAIDDDGFCDEIIGTEIKSLYYVFVGVES